MAYAEPTMATENVGVAEDGGTATEGDGTENGGGAGRKRRRPATEEEARALASSLRLRVLRLCRHNCVEDLQRLIQLIIS